MTIGQERALTGLALAVSSALVGVPLATLVGTTTSVPFSELVRVLGRVDLPGLFAQVALLGVLATAWALAAAVPVVEPVAVGINERSIDGIADADIAATRRTLRTLLTKPGWTSQEVRTLRGVLSTLDRPRGR